MLQREVLVVERASVDALAAGSIARCEVARLYHEIFHDPMKHDSLKYVFTYVN